MTATPITIRRLEPTDDRSRFRSGNIELDRFFARYAGQNQFRHHIGTTYVAASGDALLGYATVAASELVPDAIPTAKRRKLPRYPVPVLRLARLAVSEEAKGRGVGADLVRAVMSIAKQMAADLGCVGVVVDAKPESVGFYARLGFVELDVVAGELGDRPVPVPMFIELQDW